MERIKIQELEFQLRKTPLLERLKNSQRIISDMCKERRAPKMSIPMQFNDEDFYVCTTLRDAVKELEKHESS